MAPGGRGGKGLASHSALGSLVRAQPHAVPGLPVATTFDPATGALEIRYQTQPSDTAPLEISLPAMHFPSGYQVTSSDPAGTWTSVFEAATNVLAVTHDRSTPLHVVTVTPR